VATVVALAVVALNLYFAPGGQWNLPGFEVTALFSHQARQAYEDKYAPQRSLNRIINGQEDSQVRVAYFGPAYGATLEGTPFFAMGYNPGFRDETAQATSADELLGVFRRRKIKYVITPLDLASAGTPLGDALAARAERVAIVNGAGLYRLKP
jgi:hypothetical protein